MDEWKRSWEKNYEGPSDVAGLGFRRFLRRVRNIVRSVRLTETPNIQLSHQKKLEFLMTTTLATSMGDHVPVYVHMRHFTESLNKMRYTAQVLLWLSDGSHKSVIVSNRPKKSKKYTPYQLLGGPVVLPHPVAFMQVIEHNSSLIGGTIESFVQFFKAEDLFLIDAFVKPTTVAEPDTDDVQYYFRFMGFLRTRSVAIKNPLVTTPAMLFSVVSNSLGLRIFRLYTSRI